ncbi:MAG: formylmethanofuran dehydrogenase subunit C [Planctomycetales bacterium]|nr:formylmethanofuran dehydrogenase subunit C [Planctomycetales bacterium]
MPVEFQARPWSRIPIEAAGLLPERFVDASLDTLRAHRIFVGNRTVALSELFEIEGNTADSHWVFAGDLSSVQHLGEGMTSGTIIVHGDIGRHVGGSMRGGRMEIKGSAGDFAGAELRGGTLLIRGDAGHHTGGAYRGSPRGMTGGQLIVAGSAGNEVGRRMRRGLIAVGGNVGDLAGASMRAGTLVTGGSWGARAGAGMIRGTLLAWQPPREPLLPTFRHACRYTPPFLPVLMRGLSQHGLSFPTHRPSAFELWNGDLLEGGRGELLLASDNASA